MIVTEQEFTAIRSIRIKRRTLTFPTDVRCPLKAGGVYVLQPPVVLASRRREHAEQQPTRARQVLAWMDLCNVFSPKLKITVLRVERTANHQVAHFVLGAHPELFDRPVYLAKHGDYTMSASKQAVPGDPEVMTPFQKDLEAARRKATERRVSPELQSAKDGARVAETCQQAMKSMKARTLIRRAQRNYEAAARILSEEALSCETSAAADGSPAEAIDLHRGALGPCAKAAA